MDESGIDGYELEEPNGRGLGETDRGPILKRNIKRITRFVRRDSGQEKIVSIDGENHPRAALPALHVREGKLYSHHFPNPKCRHTQRRPGSRP
jgi:hypothetical protein